MEPLKIPSGCASDRVLVVNALPRDRGGHAWAAHEIAFSSAREGCNPRSPTCIKDTKGRAPPGKPINPRSQRHDIRAHRSEGPDPDSSSKGALGNGIGKRGKKRKRERERETHTHRDRETERQRDRKTERQRDSEAARQRDSETARQRDSEREREREGSVSERRQNKRLRGPETVLSTCCLWVVKALRVATTPFQNPSFCASHLVCPYLILSLVAVFFLVSLAEAVRRFRPRVGWVAEQAAATLVNSVGWRSVQIWVVLEVLK